MFSTTQTVAEDINAIRAATTVSAGFWAPHIAKAKSVFKLKRNWAAREARFSLNKTRVWEDPLWVEVRDLTESQDRPGGQYARWQINFVRHSRSFKATFGLKTGNWIAAFYNDEAGDVRLIRKLDELNTDDLAIVAEERQAGITVHGERFVVHPGVLADWKMMANARPPRDLFKRKLNEEGVATPADAVNTRHDEELPIASLAPAYIKKIPRDNAINVATSHKPGSTKGDIQFQVKTANVGPQGEQIREARPNAWRYKHHNRNFAEDDGTFRYEPATSYYLPCVIEAGPERVVMQLWEFSRGEYMVKWLSQGGGGKRIVIKQLIFSWKELREKYDNLASIVENDLDNGYYENDASVKLVGREEGGKLYVQLGRDAKIAFDAVKAAEAAAHVAESKDEKRARKDRKKAEKEARAAAIAQKKEDKAAGLQAAKIFGCDFPACEKSFTRRENLNKHKRVHQQGNEGEAAKAVEEGESAEAPDATL